MLINNLAVILKGEKLMETLEDFSAWLQSMRVPLWSGI
jgi:hypothetical protein